MAVVAAEFVDHKVERWDDEDSETACAGLIERIARRTRNVAVGVVLELERERTVRIERRRLVAEREVFGRDELLILPATSMREAVPKA